MFVLICISQHSETWDVGLFAMNLLAQHGTAVFRLDTLCSEKTWIEACVARREDRNQTTGYIERACGSDGEEMGSCVPGCTALNGNPDRPTLYQPTAMPNSSVKTPTFK